MTEPNRPVTDGHQSETNEHALDDQDQDQHHGRRAHIVAAVVDWIEMEINRTTSVEVSDGAFSLPPPHLRAGGGGGGGGGGIIDYSL